MKQFLTEFQLLPTVDSCYGQLLWSDYFFFKFSLTVFLQEEYTLLEQCIACYSGDNYEQKNVKNV